MFLYIASLMCVIFFIKKFNLLKYYVLDLEYNEQPFTVNDLHSLNRNFDWPDYKGGMIRD
jgi:hypothetical protein